MMIDESKCSKPFVVQLTSYEPDQRDQMLARGPYPAHRMFVNGPWQSD